MACKSTEKIRFSVDFISRVQRRTISNYIEHCLAEAIDREQYEGRAVNDVMAEIWDVDETERFINLCLALPNVLTYEEEVLWKLIRENGYFWEKPVNGSLSMNNKKSVRMQRVKDYWQILLNVSKNNIPASYLPTSPDGKANPEQTPDLSDFIQIEEGCNSAGVTSDV